MGLGFRFWNFQGLSDNFVEYDESLFSLKFLKVKWQIYKFQGGFQKSISPTPQPHFLEFCCNSAMLLILIAILTIDDMQDDVSDMLRFLLKY